jgi:hypothetical protein
MDSLGGGGAPMLGWFRKKRPRPIGPDFSAIDSREKAAELFERGDLEKLFLMPLEFGGEDNTLNTLFVPVGLAGVKARIDANVIAPLAADGKITKYKAMPEYQGRSVIPIAIRVEASDPGSFTTTINIWGEVLAREDTA